MKRYIIALSLILLPFKAFSGDIIGIRQDTSSLPVLLQAEYLEDKDGALSFDAVKESEGWKKTSKESVNFGFTKSVYWFRFTIENRGTKDPVYYLELDYPMLDYVDLYIPDESGAYTVNKTGDLLPFSQRDVNDRKIMFKITPPGFPGTYYMRIKTTSSVNFSLTLLSIYAYIDKIKQDLPAFWAFYGLMAVLLIFNLLVFVMTRTISYFYYVFYLSAWVLFQFTLNGFAYQHLWPNLPWWGNKCLPLFISLVVVGCGMMVREFLRTAKNHPIADKVAIGLIIAPGVIWSFVSLIAPYKTGIKGATAIALSGSLTMIILSAVLVLRGSRNARFFLVSWLFMMVGIILYTLKTFGILPSNFLTNWSIQIGSSMTAILLSGALAENINVMRREVLSLNTNLKESENVAKERANYLEEVVSTVRDMSDNMLTVSDELALISDRFSMMSGDQEKTSSDMSREFDILSSEYSRLHTSIKSQRDEGTRTRELSGSLQKSQESITRATETVTGSINQIAKMNSETEITLRGLIDKMKMINEGGKSIDEFMAIIEDITDRINLLSLNAAIEAARAGEHGRGFAVVADEIGKLASATADNSKQISNRITSIIQDITEGTDLMNSTKHQFEHTFGIINTISSLTSEVKDLVTGQDHGINRIVEQAGIMDNLSQEIESATGKQSRTISDGIATVAKLAEMAHDISSSNTRILELTSLVKEKSTQMSNAVRQVK